MSVFCIVTLIWKCMQLCEYELLVISTKVHKITIKIVYTEISCTQMCSRISNLSVKFDYPTVLHSSINKPEFKRRIKYC